MKPAGPNEPVDPRLLPALDELATLLADAYLRREAERMEQRDRAETESTKENS
jgi:hypothetical protein